MKHLLNDMSEKEKNSIREQHTGGKQIINEKFSILVNSKLGDAKPLVSEQSFGGIMRNLGEIIGKAASLLVNSIPLVRLEQMKKAADEEDDATFNQILDDNKAALGEKYAELKTAMKEGDVKEFLKNLGPKLGEFISKIKLKKG